jgi:hypothetical protein
MLFIEAPSAPIILAWMVRASSAECRSGREFHGQISRLETGRKKYIVGGAYRHVGESRQVIQYF